MNKVIVIAEAGVNHNGDMALARQLIDVAAESGADYVKFQTFKTEKLVSQEAKRAEYQKHNMACDEDITQFNMLKKLELSEADHNVLIEHCRLRNIRFLSTAFDLESVDLLYSLGMDLFKIPSGEITNYPYLKKIGGLNTRVVVSTGMCVMSEIADALNVLVASGTNRENIIVLHCTSDYPTAMLDVNLNAMLNIAKELNVKIGYSDHTLGIEVPIAAVGLGAQIIEKHFTLDKNLPGPDHKASLEPAELIAMVKGIRNIERAMGSAMKQPTEAEKKNMLLARKSIHLAHMVEENHVLTESDLEMKRPGDGISPMSMASVIGKKTKQRLNTSHKLKWEDIE
ncbi:MAG: N-acetylneuraminate synthase [Flavobacteriales bacterium]|jgi:N,N'-diacetyllegionaminate synthase|nr:N-acetylneuraminate synthase [Flavobacteriales bacterium]